MLNSCTYMATVGVKGLTWYIVLRLQGHVTVKEESRSSQYRVDGPRQNSRKTLQSTAENW